MAETTINYASKYSDVIDERFKLSSVTTEAVNNNYDFSGVNTVYVYSAELAELGDYNMSAGSNRYGTPKELGNRVQELKLSQDKAFTFTIDRRNSDDTMMTQQAAKCLQRHIDEIVVPTIDKYRLSKLSANAGVSATFSYAKSSSPYEHYLDVAMQLTENEIPTENRIVYMTPKFYKALRLDPQFVGTSDSAANIAQSGNLTKIDGASIKVVPSSYLPTGTNFIITHPIAMCSPVKLAEYNTHDNPPGISGWLVEGRVYYDVFVLNNKKKAIAISNVSESNGTENSEPSEVTDFSSMTVEQLKEYAEANGIELNGATTKDAIIAVIEAHEAT